MAIKMGTQSNSLTKFALCCILAVTGCSASILAWASKNNRGSYNYNTSGVPFLSESLKLAIASVLLWITEKDFHGKLPLSSKLAAKYFLLGFLYSVQNNLLFYTLKHVEVATFQVLINLKIALSAVLLVIFAKRIFRLQQQIGLFLLVAGASMSQLVPSRASDRLLQIDSIGLTLVSSMIFISSGAGVLNELLLKDAAGGSLHWQNAQLYFFGSLFTFLKMYFDLGQISWRSVIAGYNVFTWLSILNLAFLGIITSAVLKHADNLLRSFASVASLFLATLVSWLFMDAEISAMFLVGMAITSLALLIYTGSFDIQCDIRSLFSTVTSSLKCVYFPGSSS